MLTRKQIIPLFAHKQALRNGQITKIRQKRRQNPYKSLSVNPLGLIGKTNHVY